MIKYFIKIPLIILFSFASVHLIGQNWYMGNTHAHTKICGHADSSPDVVTKWYHDHGYNFLILSEHNHFIDPDTVQLPPNKRDDFILIPGEEVTGSKKIHTTAMNIEHIVSWDFNHEQKAMIIQNHVNGTNSAGGYTILNHPNYKYAVSVKDILPVNNLYLFELFNGHPAVNNSGDSLNMSTEAMWDALLTQGYRIYGVSSDDAHYFENIGRDISNPGKGWVMVNAPQLDAMHITQAMVEGKFYATNGVILNTYDNSSIGTYMVDIDINKTSEIISALNLWGKCVIQGEPGFRVEFIGPNGEIISSVNTTKAAFNSTKHYKYIRAKIVYTVVDNTAECTVREYYAWVQPVFSSP